MLGCATSHFSSHESYLDCRPTSYLVVIEDDFGFSIAYKCLVEYLEKMDEYCNWVVIILSTTDPAFYRVVKHKLVPQNIYKYFNAKSAAVYIVNVCFVLTLKKLLS